MDYGNGREYGRMMYAGVNGAQGMGSGGKCVCPRCGHTVSHDRGEPCITIACPKCGTMMIRKI